MVRGEIEILSPAPHKTNETEVVRRVAHGEKPSEEYEYPSELLLFYCNSQIMTNEDTEISSTVYRGKDH